MPRARQVCAEAGCPRLRPCSAHPGRDRHRFDVRATPKGADVPASVKRAVLERDGGRCHICGQLGADTCEHVLARALGGSNDPSNLRAAHRRCNAIKAGSESHESRRRRASR